MRAPFDFSGVMAWLRGTLSTWIPESVVPWVLKRLTPKTPKSVPSPGPQYVEERATVRPPPATELPKTTRPVVPALPGFASYPKAARYWAIVEREAIAQGVPVGIVYGVMAAESAFNERAYRSEPHINDASRGLMQLLYRTARSLGYSGSAEGLYDPATNISLGTQYLADGLSVHNGDVWAAVSRYNNGSGKRATRVTKVCLWRNPDRSCAQYFTAQKGEFLNAPYVDKVRRYAAMFGYFDDGDRVVAEAGIGPVLGLMLIGIGLRKLFT